MNKFTKLAMLAATFAVLAACAKTAPPATAAAADESAIRAVNIAWNKAYNAGDGAAVAALYADDAVLSAPGTPMVRGKVAITEYYVKDAAGFATTGFTVADDPVGELGQSGDLAWQSGTYKNTDKSGTTVDAGKFLTVFQRKDGKWAIIRDTWNSDTAPATHVASAPSQ